MRVRKPIEDRFWSRVTKSDGCWVWTGPLNERGYGVIGKGGRGAGMMLVHRLSFRIEHGVLPEDHILHHCDNPPCVRPAHLFAGTQADNVMDMVAKGRHVSWNRKKTHCKRNHVFDIDNTYIRANGARSCRECHKEWQRDYMLRKAKND